MVWWYHKNKKYDNVSLDLFHIGTIKSKIWAFVFGAHKQFAAVIYIRKANDSQYCHINKDLT